MSEVVENFFDKKKFIWATVVCIIVGILPALVISRETSGYVAGMAFGYLVLFCGLPLIFILFVVAIGTAFENKAQYTALLLMSCVLIPVSFVISLKIMEATKIAVYKRDGVDEIKPMEFEAAKGWTVVFQKGLSSNQRQKFTNDNFFPWKPDIGFTHESGVCQLSGQSLKDYEAVTIYFCSNVTEKQKAKLRVKLKESEILYKFYENTSIDEIINQNKEIFETKATRKQ